MEDFSEQQIKLLTDVVERVVDARLVANNAVLEKAFDTKLGQFEDSFDAKLGKLEGSFDAKLDHLEGSFDTKLGRLESSFDTKLGKLEGSFDAKLDQLEGSFDDKLEKNNAVLEKSIDARMKVAITQAISEEGRTTREYVDQSIKASENRIIESVGEMLSDSIIQQIDIIDQRVDDHDRRLTKLEKKSV